MLGKNVATVLCRSTNKYFCVPKRSWTQVGHVISTPPRVKCSYTEKCLHAMFMLTFWLSPMAYFLTQIKVWRRVYIE
ncbi:unnamed protein product [Parnassius mnemosyne]|uniref:Uncharacterized protein n=1 Tax=Parnassius mnemosyne TaxID=213953 RepID=A0AAV1LH40_9NEOP